MSYVITKACVGVCGAECVEVCPVDCIAGPVDLEALRRVPRPERASAFPDVQLFINADECTSCGACAAACPSSAIFDEDALPASEAGAREANAAFFRLRARGGT